MTEPELLSSATSAREIVLGMLRDQANDVNREKESSLALYPAPYQAPAGRPKSKAKERKEKKEHRRGKGGGEQPPAMKKKQKKAREENKKDNE